MFGKIAFTHDTIATVAAKLRVGDPFFVNAVADGLCSHLTLFLFFDYEWFAADEWNVENNNKVQKFFCETHKDEEFKIYEIDGTVIEQPALHPVAMIATNAQASLAANGPYAKECVERFWNTPLRKGERRYYDNCLYLFALLALSGNYRIY